MKCELMDEVAGRTRRVQKRDSSFVLMKLMLRQNLRVERRFTLFAMLLGLPVLTLGLAAEGAEPLIQRGASGWRFHDRPSQLDPDAVRTWHTAEFDDSSWSEGQALLGYGDPDVVCQLSYGEHPQRKQASAFFRRRFRLVNRTRFLGFGGRVCCDDGAVVYVNGREVFRHNMPMGPVTASTHAVRAVGPGSNESERSYHAFLIPADVTHEGDNVIAISVHQANPTSSDLAMDVELQGLTEESELSNYRPEGDATNTASRSVGESGSTPSPVVRFKVGSDS